MTSRIFFRGRELRRCFAASRIVKHGIVAKTALTQAFVQDSSTPRARRQEWLRLGMQKETGNTMKFSAAIILRNTFEFIEQMIDIFVVCRGRARIARRIYAGPPIQGVDQQSRVIGNCRQPCCSHRMTGFDDGILLERRAGLFCIADIEVGLRHDHNLEMFEKTSYLPNFSGVAAGHDDFRWQFQESA